MNDADEYFGIDEYTDLVVLTKPVIYMTIQEIGETHQTLLNYIDRIAPFSKDPLREIINMLGQDPNILMENFFSPNNLQSVKSYQEKNDSLNQTSPSNYSFNKNTQICLTLTNRFAPDDIDDRIDLNNLYIK